MSEELIPASSAMHGVTWGQNVAREVGERIDAIRARKRRWFRTAVVMSPLVAALFTVVLPHTDPELVFALAEGALITVGALWALFFVARQAESKAAVLDRARDLSWVTKTNGLVFFGDDAFFVERGVGLMNYAAPYQVTTDGGMLRLQAATGFTIAIVVPEGFSEADADLVRARVGRRVMR